MSRHNRDDEFKDDRNKPQKEVQNFDQLSAVIGDGLPGLWWRMYDNMLASGFTEEQAMSLLRCYIKTAYLPPGLKE